MKKTRRWKGGWNSMEQHEQHFACFAFFLMAVYATLVGRPRATGHLEQWNCVKFLWFSLLNFADYIWKELMTDVPRQSKTSELATTSIRSVACISVYSWWNSRWVLRSYKIDCFFGLWVSRVLLDRFRCNTYHFQCTNMCAAISVFHSEATKSFF